MADIRRLRQAGLETNGENSVENLAYKLLRSRGRIDKLAKHINKLQGSSLSLGEEMKIKEILGEDDTTPMKVQSVTGDKAVIDQAGTDIEVSKDDLIANPDKPGELQLKSDPSKIKPGATVTTPTTAVAENQEEDLENKDVIDSGKNGKISGDSTDAQLAHRVYKADGNTSIRDIKKYLLHQIGEKQGSVELYYNSQILGCEWTLEYLSKTICSHKDILLVYLIRQN